ncbi:hypothetical protein SAMN05519103_06146 [Rhizobiales bacterium GAS113]|nr:hypothetical protein SAMN05519103_06146 [Rhizobiales bacterium GAS113]
MCAPRPIGCNADAAPKHCGCRVEAVPCVCAHPNVIPNGIASNQATYYLLWEYLVLDIVFLALACALFLLGAGYAALCDRL